MTPFGSEYARSFVCDEILDGFIAVIEYLNIEADTMTKPLGSGEEKAMRKVLRKYSDLSAEEQEAIISGVSDDTDAVDEEMCYEIWAAACLLDAAFCGGDYSAGCIGYQDRYEEAVQKLRTEAQKRKILSRRPKYNVPETIQNIVDALDYVLGVNCDSELAAEMERSGRKPEWEQEIIDLQVRLGNRAESWDTK